MGALEVSEGDRVLPVRSGKQQALLALFLCRPGAVVHSDLLIDSLWGPDAGDQGGRRLRLQLHRLRRLLGTAEVIVHRTNGYALRTPIDAVDARRFERLAHEGRQTLMAGRLAGASDLLRAALGLWRGPALSGLDATPVLHQEATRLEEERLAVHGDCIDADLRLGRHSELIGELSVLVREHPLRERFRAQLMLALYRSGRQAEALASYRDARRHLCEALGLEPSAELRRLELAILTNDSSLNPTDRPPLILPAPLVVSTPTVGAPSTFGTPNIGPPPTFDSTPTPGAPSTFDSTPATGAPSTFDSTPATGAPSTFGSTPTLSPAPGPRTTPGSTATPNPGFTASPTTPNPGHTPDPTRRLAATSSPTPDPAASASAPTPPFSPAAGPATSNPTSDPLPAHPAATPSPSANPGAAATPGLTTDPDAASANTPASAPAPAPANPASPSALGGPPPAAPPPESPPRPRRHQRVHPRRPHCALCTPAIRPERRG
ncbi:BTAD domain-containing putative transcriptional regulator [Nonomuraea sp. NPDC050328]|uniref:AfsR/SARP family transcriptional regulator n=1 Tax=Nonomuraea sp. NPDC050328 TaxID=3364361 RepID=UPI0037909036